MFSNWEDADLVVFKKTCVFCSCLLLTVTVVFVERILIFVHSSSSSAAEKTKQERNGDRTARERH